METVRHILGKKVKTGHGGTLDSTASGLLLVLIGPATRLSGYVMEMPKCYEAVIQLGSETTTDDAAGEVKSVADWSFVTDTLIDNVLPAFLGWRMQEPPQISAVHIGGERAHRLAREGKQLPLEPKPVNITKIERLGLLSPNGRIAVRVLCHKGTYIRSLARDIGRRLGCGAHVHTLHRIGSGPFSAAGSPSPEQISQLGPGGIERYILPVESLYSVSTRYQANETMRKSVMNGCTQTLNQLNRINFGLFETGSTSVVMTLDGVFSICGTKRHGKTIEISPEVNIFYGGDAAR